MLAACRTSLAAPSAIGQQAYTAPKNGYGQPDFSGAWTNESLTPFEALPPVWRAAGDDRGGGREAREGRGFALGCLQRAHQPQRRRAERRKRGRLQLLTGSATSTRSCAWAASRAPRRSPPPGTAACRREEGRAAEADQQPADDLLTPDVGDLTSYETRSGTERCIFWPSHAGAVMRHAAYNANYRITQGKDAVAIMVETINDTRIVRLNSKHHPGSAVTRPWMGDSIGWYEGDTLVVETINYHPEQYFYYASEQLKVTERFTRVGEHHLLYQFKVEDPKVWDEPGAREYTSSTARRASLKMPATKATTPWSTPSRSGARRMRN